MISINIEKAYAKHLTELKSEIDNHILEYDQLEVKFHEFKNKSDELTEKIDSCKNKYKFIIEEFQKNNFNSIDGMGHISINDDEISHVKLAVNSCRKWKDIVPYLITQYDWKDSPNNDIKKYAIIAHASINTFHLR